MVLAGQNKEVQEESRSGVSRTEQKVQGCSLVLLGGLYKLEKQLQHILEQESMHECRLANAEYALEELALGSTD